MNQKEFKVKTYILDLQEQIFNTVIAEAFVASWSIQIHKANDYLFEINRIT